MPEKIGVQAVFEDAQFKKGVADYNKGLSDAEKNTENFADAGENVTKGLKGVDQGMLDTARSSVDLAAKMIIVEKAFNDIKQLAQQGLELAKLGATAERVEQRFGMLAESAGGADEILRAFQVGAGGAASQMDAMLSSSKLLQMGLVDDAESMERVVEMASRLGDQTMTVGDRVQDFALMLANQSIPRLDNFGISSGKVRARIIELQAATEGMTRETAFMQATMEAGGDSLIRLGDRVEDDAMAFEKMEAAMADARVELGQKLAGVAAKAIGIFGSLGDEAMLVFAAFGEFGGALIKLGPLLAGFGPMIAGKVIPAVKGLTAAIGGMSLATGALTLGIPILIGLIVNFVGVLGKIDTNFKNARGAADDWSEAIDGQIAGGREAATVFGEYGRKADEAASAWNKNIVTSTVLGAVFGTQSKLLKIIGEAQSEVTQAAIESSDTYEEAASKIDIYNSQVEDAAWKIQDFTEASYDLTKSLLEFTSPAERSIDLITDLAQALLDGEFAAKELEDQIFFTNRELTDMGIATQDTDRAMLNAADAATILGSEEYKLGQIKEERIARELAVAQAEKDGLQAAEAARKKTYELAQANEAARKAANDHRLAMLGLAQQLSGLEEPADAAMIVLGLLEDLYQDNLFSGEDLAVVTEDLGLALGDLTPEGLAAADAAEALSWAVSKGYIPLDKAAEVAFEYGEAVANSTLDTQGLLDKFSTIPLFFDPATGAIRTFNIATGEGAQPTAEMRKEMLLLHDGVLKLPSSAIPAAEALKGLGEKAGGVKDPVTGAWEASVKLGDAVARIPAVADPAATSIGGYTGKASAGFPHIDALADKTLKLDEAAGPIPESVDPASTSVTGFGTASSEAIEPVQNLKGEIQTVPDVADETAGRMTAAGSAMVANLESGFNARMSAFIETVRRALQIVGDMMPGSEPKDTSSPLYGLSSAGEAIINNILDGINIAEQGWKSTLDTLFAYVGSFGGVAGAAGKFVTKEARELEIQLRGIDKQIKDWLREMGFSGTSAEAMIEIEAGLSDRDLNRRARMGDEKAQKEIIRLQEAKRQIYELVKLEEERTEIAEKHAVLQEKILNLQEKQMKLQFLQAQFKLFDMLREAGLSFRDIFAGVEFGLDADMGKLMDAMSEALEQLIKQAEEKLDISSPSKVFERMGGAMMEGMALGIREMSMLPIRESLIATQSVVQGPYASGGGSVDNSRTVNISLGGQTIASAREGQLFEQRVTRAVQRGMRGT